MIHSYWHVGIVFVALGLCCMVLRTVQKCVIRLERLERIVRVDVAVREFDRLDAFEDVADVEEQMRSAFLEEATLAEMRLFEETLYETGRLKKE